MKQAAERKIIHMDMDAFYASVEQLDQPELRGKPLAVGGSADRGVVAAASYEARKFGVRSAMSSKIAARKCPELIFVRPRFDRYQEISREIHRIFGRYTDLIEPLSLDEAFLDVTVNKLNQPSATFIAQAIKNDVKNELGLTVSAGVSYNKFLAKMASDQDKPDGLFVIEPHQAIDFLNTLPIDRFFGIGKVTAEKLKEFGITTGKQLRQFSKELLIREFGKAGSFFYHIARGVDHRPVEPSRERKSIAVEHTLSNDIYLTDEVRNQAGKILNELWQRYERSAYFAKSLTLKLKFDDFSQITRSLTIRKPFLEQKQLENEALKLIQSVIPLQQPIRLLGFQLSNLQLKDSEIPPDEIQTMLEF